MKSTFRLALCSLTLGPVVTLAAADALAAAKAASPAPVPYALILGPIRLYENKAPGALGDRPQDTPTLTPHLPEPAKRNGAFASAPPSALLSSGARRTLGLFFQRTPPPAA